MTTSHTAFPACVRASSNKQFNEKIIRALKEKIASSPQAHLYQTLVNTYRKSGQLELAAKASGEWLKLSPTDIKAKYLRDILNNTQYLANPHRTDEIQPAPYSIFSNFLSTEERNHFWQLAQNNKDRFNDAGIGLGEKNVIDESKRVTQVLQLNKDDKILFLNHLKPVVLKSLERFKIHNNGIKSIEVKLTAHDEGGFFEIHQDGFEVVGNGHRHLSWIYYFHKTPKRYKGGELVIFDSTCQPEEHRYMPSEFTRYIPKDNELIIFPSWFHHGVTHVRKQIGDFSASRFAVAGHVIC